MAKFKALIANQEDGKFNASIQEIDQSALPPAKCWCASLIPA